MPNTEAPSKTLLLERREERALVTEGKSVLEERRDTLAQAIINELRALAPLHEALQRDLDDARRELRQAALRHGPIGLRRLAASQTGLPDPGWRTSNYFGTRMVSATASSAEPARETRWDSSEDTARARLAFHGLCETLLEVAPLLNNLSRLTREFRRTERKVNALEHVVVPEIQTAIRSIEFALEEMERENMVRALHVKRSLERLSKERASP